MPAACRVGYDYDCSGGAPVNRNLLIAFLGSVMISGATAYAHHSFAATYITDKEIKIEGDMVQFMFPRDTLKAGDHVIITGNPGRTSEDHRIRMRSIFRPKDGFKWSGDFQ